MIVKASLLLGCAMLSAMPAQARIVSMQVLKTEPAFGGQSFGTAGSYDHVTARVEGVLDPADRRNAIIQGHRLGAQGRAGDGALHHGCGTAEADGYGAAATAP